MFRTATVLALVGTAAAAGTYPTDDVSCGILDTSFQCVQLESADVCKANTDCQYIVEVWGEGTDWEESYSYCHINAALQTVRDYGLTNATDALKTQLAACQSITTQANCVGSCAWGNVDDDDTGETEGCLVSRSKGQTLLIADGADPLTKGYSYYLASRESACPVGGTDETTCNAITACEWDSDRSECTGNEAASALLVNNKCQGSLSDAILEFVNSEGTAEAAENADATWTNKTIIAEVYTMNGVPDETDATKLAAQADAKVKDAETKTANAEKLKESIPTTGLATADITKLDFLATAAIAGKTVKKVVVAITATDETEACSSTFTKMGLTSDDGACTATTARRRNLLAAYSTSVLLDPAKVDETAAATAAAKIEADPTVTTTVTDENPVDEIEAIPNIETTAVTAFRTSAVIAAEANVEAEAYQAEEADVTTSGANTAAPAMVVISTLVGALAIFA